MKIISAHYGSKDVLGTILSSVKNNRIYIQASNSIFGDPEVGQIKYLKVKAEVDGRVEEYSVKENSFLSIPKTNINKLGIFYSNNNNKSIYPCIIKSLQTIEIASKNKADIVTNLWNSLGENNPFIETIAWTQHSSHLNQVLQILQCLYVAKEIKEYLYVSFLEHDVLYPEGYFDYEDFETVICNMNYIGVNKEGFQARNQDDKPLSQMTMRFDYAIEHFSKILENAILTNSGLSEPQVQIQAWNCKNPSVHVNHGKHFTSHYNIYSKNDITQNNQYWGDHKSYINLF